MENITQASNNKYYTETQEGDPRIRVRDLDLSEGSVVYKLYDDGSLEQTNSETLLLPHELYIDHKLSRLFPCTHDLLVKNWNNSDYDFIFAKGYCESCYLTEITTVIQKGTLRFGCPSGYCIECLSQQYKYNPIEIKIEYKFDKSLPGEEGMIHTAIYNVELPGIIMQISRKIIGGESRVREEELQTLANKAESLRDLIEISEYQKSKPFVCKQCDGHIKLHDLVNSVRQNGTPIAQCPGCDTLLGFLKGCSTVKCIGHTKKQCISPTSVCMYCLDGRNLEGISHNLSQCSQLLEQKKARQEELPLAKECECQNLV